jgi:hypothetical protein
MTTQQPQPRPQQPTPRRREEPDLDPNEVLTMSRQSVTAQLQTAKSIASQVLGDKVDNETIIAVYDRLSDKIAELLGGDDSDDEE